MNAVRSFDPTLDVALGEIARLHAENGPVINDFIAWLKERPHTAEITLQIRGHKLTGAELRRVSRGS